MNDSLSPSRFHPSCHMEHKVQAGDTLAGIALRYQTTVHKAPTLTDLPHIHF